MKEYSELNKLEQNINKTKVIVYKRGGNGFLNLALFDLSKPVSAYLGVTRFHSGLATNL